MMAYARSASRACRGAPARPGGRALFGTQDVAPPPPTVSSGGTSGTARNAAAGSGGSLTNNVVPPPPSVGSGTARGAAGAQSGSLSTGVVPPPPSIAGSSNSTSGKRSGINPRRIQRDPPAAIGRGFRGKFRSKFRRRFREFRRFRQHRASGQQCCPATTLGGLRTFRLRQKRLRPRRSGRRRISHSLLPEAKAEPAAVPG